MGEFANREHYIPVRVTDLVECLCRETSPVGGALLHPDDQTRFHRFARSVSLHMHAIYQDELRRLKDAYAPFDPDADPKPLDPPTAEQRAGAQDRLFATFCHMMERANYTHLSRADLEQVMKGASDWGVDMDVTWDAFDRLEVFVRGKGNTRRTRPGKVFWWKKKEVEVPTFGRVAVILRQRPHKRLGPGADTENVFLKLFKDIPTQDIEMLLPATRIKLATLDRFKLGGSVTGTIGLVSYKLSTLSLAGLVGALSAGAFLTLYGPVALVLGYGYRTWYGFQVTRQTYSLQLTQSLYYQNLDNNGGVMYRLLDEAEEQETRETLLAYYHLWRYAGDRGWTAAELDDFVESDLERRLNLAIDFEVGDALRKLERAGIAEVCGDHYRAIPLEVAQTKLDALWERYPNAGIPQPPELQEALGRG
jgi:hypothetical protein